MKTYNKPKNVVIKRKKWQRGNGSDNSALLLEKTGKMCCLGFWCLEAGFSPKQLKNVCDPFYLIDIVAGIAEIDGLVKNTKGMPGPMHKDM